MSEQYPYPPPVDAKEWACSVCGCDGLWCGCAPPTALRLAQIRGYLQHNTDCQRSSPLCRVCGHGSGWLDHSIGFVPTGHRYEPDEQPLCTCGLAEAFAALARAEQERDAWKDAIIDAAVVDWIYTAEHETNPRKAVNDLLCWQQTIALDPAISKPAHDLVERAERAEAELARAEQTIREPQAEKDSARVAPPVDCVATAGSTAEQPTGAVTTAERLETPRYFRNVHGFGDGTRFLRLNPDGTIVGVREDWSEWSAWDYSAEKCLEHVSRGVWKELTEAEALAARSRPATGAPETDDLLNRAVAEYRAATNEMPRVGYVYDKVGLGAKCDRQERAINGLLAAALSTE